MFLLYKANYLYKQYLSRSLPSKRKYPLKNPTSIAGTTIPGSIRKAALASDVQRRKTSLCPRRDRRPSAKKKPARSETWGACGAGGKDYSSLTSFTRIKSTHHSLGPEAKTHHASSLQNSKHKPTRAAPLPETARSSQF